MSQNLGDVTPRLRIEEATDYQVELSAHSNVDSRESEFGPIYSITCLHDDAAVLLVGGQNLIDQVIPLLPKSGAMVNLRVSKEWVTDPESGEKKMQWEVNRL